MSPDDPRHGTNAGATAHHYAGTPLCEPCKQAKRRATKVAQVAREQGRPLTVALGKRAHRIVATAHVPQLSAMTGISTTHLRAIAKAGPEQKVRRVNRDAILRAGTELQPITALGIQRRIQALHALGWNCADLARESGITSESLEDHRDGRPRFLRLPVAEAVAEAYEAMSCRLPEPTTPHARSIATKARNKAKANGWPPPLAWDDIDDPDERPKGNRTEQRYPRNVGRPEVIAERIEDFDFLVSCGESEAAAAARLGVRLDSFLDQRRRYEREGGAA